MCPKYRSVLNDESYKPKDFYKELAEYGLLDEYVRERMSRKLSDSEEFKEEIINILSNYSTKHVPVLDLLYLEKLKEHLDIFLKKVELCKNQKR
jgi:hypothetical protein